jgi:hypothetical protein
LKLKQKKMQSKINILSLAAILFPVLTSAQSCQQNVTMDDFKLSPQPNQFFDGADRFINLLGGDYGGDNVTMNFDNVAQGYMTVTPSRAGNFFFFKANREACYDLRSFTGLRWDMEAPVGAQSDLTLTVMHANCTTRDDAGDSSYKIVTPYTAGNATTGQRQTFVAPLDDFKTNTRGQPYDFQHFKDFTFVNMKPVGASFRFYFFEMVGNCTPIPVANNGSTTTNSTGGTNNTTDSGLSKKPNSASTFGISAFLGGLALLTVLTL